VGANGWDFFDELLDRLDGLNGTAAVRTGRKRNLDVLVDMWRYDTMAPGMPFRTTGSLSLCLGDFAGIAPPERRGLPRRLPLSVVELVTKQFVLSRQRGDLLLQFGNLGAERLNLLAELIDLCESVCQC
jgi:hypothetical protein